MDVYFFLKGVAIGFSIAAPVGPIGLLCIQRTLDRGRNSGLLSGLGAATADAFYGSVAAFGLVFVSGFLVEEQGWIRLIGGAFLIGLGARIWLRRPVELAVAPAYRQRLVVDYASTLALTLTNPVTVVAFAAVFAGLGLGSRSGDYVDGATLVSGVFTGSALWWVLLSTVVSMLRRAFNPSRMRLLDGVAGTVIVAFGVVAILSVVL